MQTEQPRSGGPWTWLVGAGLLVAVASVWLFGFRAPGLVLGGVLALAGSARLVLPTRLAGTLAVRSRLVDVVTLWVLAGAVVALALTAPST